MLQKNLKITGILVSVVLLICLVLGSFSYAQDAKPKYRIGFVVKALTNPFYQRMQAAAQAKADELGVEVLFQATTTETDVEGFIRIIEDMIIKKVDGIIAIPGAPTETAPVLNKAVEKGIAVMAVETDSPDVDTITFLGVDNIYITGLIAKYVFGTSEVPDDAEYAIMTGVAGYATAENRAKGFEKGVKEGFPNAKLVALLNADWNRDKGMTVGTDIITAHPNVKVIFCSNDEMGLGAVEAIKLAGKEGQIVATGLDANMDALLSVQKGEMICTLDQKPEAYGAEGIDIVVRYLNGEKFPEFIGLDTPLVTKDNVDQFIEAAKNTF